MKHSAHVPLRHVLFSQRMKTSYISHPEGPGLLHVLLIHMCVSLLSMGKSETQQLLLNCFSVWVCPDARSGLSTHSELSISPHSHSSTWLSTRVFIFYFLYELSSCQICLARANGLFPHQVKCNGNFRECTCILNVCFDEDMPELGDPWRLLEKTKKEKSVLVAFLDLNSSKGCLRWYWSIIQFDP